MTEKNQISIATPEGQEVFNDRITMLLNSYIENAILENPKFDMRKAPQSRWNSALLYINANYFRLDKSVLQLKPFIYDKFLCCLSNKGQYNSDKVKEVLDTYIILCMEYDKEISINGFSFLTGIGADTISSWKNRKYSYCDEINGRGETLYCDIFKRLVNLREESLSDKLVSSNQAIAILGVLNRHYGWNTGQQKESTITLEVKTSDEIAAKYGLKLSDNSGQNP